MRLKLILLLPLVCFNTVSAKDKTIDFNYINTENKSLGKYERIELVEKYLESLASKMETFKSQLKKDNEKIIADLRNQLQKQIDANKKLAEENKNLISLLGIEKGEGDSVTLKNVKTEAIPEFENKIQEVEKQIKENEDKYLSLELTLKSLEAGQRINDQLDKKNVPVPTPTKAPTVKKEEKIKELPKSEEKPKKKKLFDITPP